MRWNLCWNTSRTGRACARKSSFAEENGQEASADDLCVIFEAIKQDFADEAAEDSKSESVSSEAESAEELDAFCEEMDIALEHVHDLGAPH